MDQAARRSGTAKGGPRVFTVTPSATLAAKIIGAMVNNCQNCEQPSGVALRGETGVLDEFGLFVHGWYSLETDINIFWQQVNPTKACSTNPQLTGRKLIAGSCIPFFVDQSTIDGVIVIAICDDQDFPSNSSICGPLGTFSQDDFIFDANTFTQGLIRVSRVDTVLLMSETGDNATNMAPPPSTFCE